MNPPSLHFLHTIFAKKNPNNLFKMAPCEAFHILGDHDNVLLITLFSRGKQSTSRGILAKIKGGSPSFL
jgi:hypothetical protein